MPVEAENSSLFFSFIISRYPSAGPGCSLTPLERLLLFTARLKDVSSPRGRVGPEPHPASSLPVTHPRGVTCSHSGANLHIYIRTPISTSLRQNRTARPPPPPPRGLCVPRARPSPPTDKVETTRRTPTLFRQLPPAAPPPKHPPLFPLRVRSAIQEHPPKAPRPTASPPLRSVRRTCTVTELLIQRTWPNTVGFPICNSHL